MEHTVMVWEKPHKITVNQKSRSVWIATGVYMGEMLVVKGRTESQAISAWREAARYKGN
jgi:hypothetical protein